eukprot:g4611.t1
MLRYVCPEHQGPCETAVLYPDGRVHQQNLSPESLVRPRNIVSAELDLSKRLLTAEQVADTLKQLRSLPDWVPRFSGAVLVLNLDRCNLSELPTSLVGARPSDRDACTLRAQLEPWPTRELRKRLVAEFGYEGSAEDVDNLERSEVMAKLLEGYEAERARREKQQLEGLPKQNKLEELQFDGAPHSTSLGSILKERRRELQMGGGRALTFYNTTAELVCANLREELLQALKAWAAEMEKRNKPRERPSVKAQNYMILRRREIDDIFAINNNGGSVRGATPARRTTGTPDVHVLKQEDTPTKAFLKQKRLYEKKARLWGHIWRIAEKIIAEHDASFAAHQWTQLAVTHNFQGSPHIDKQNTGFFYALAVGDFSGGEICVEEDARKVAVVNTKDRIAKIDGRFPHWVAPWGPCCEDVGNGPPPEAVGHLDAAGVALPGEMVGEPGDSHCNRFSLIFYQTEGAWDAPEKAVLCAGG